MSTTATSPAAADAVAGDAVSIKRRWWLEIVYVLIFYIIYSMIRNQFGSGGNFAVGNQRALDNAKLIIDIEKSIGLFIEEAVQEAVIGWDWFVQFWNVFYGSLHFVITGAAMIYLYARVSEPLSALSECSGRHHVVRPDRVSDVSAHATSAPQRRPAVRCHAQRLHLRRHAGRCRGPVVVRFRNDAVDLQSVGRDAKPSHRVGDVVHGCAIPRVSQNQRKDCLGAVPGVVVVRHRCDRQPLLDRRGGWCLDPVGWLARGYPLINMDSAQASGT